MPASSLPSRHVRRLAVIGVSAACLTALSPATGASAETFEFGELVNCLSVPRACAAAADAWPWSQGTAKALFPGEGEDGTRADAFRHCAWSGAIAQRVGVTDAEQVTTAHETNTADRDNLPAYASMAMDLANNATGHALGARANAEGGSDTWGWIIDQCYNLASTNQLVVIR